jgi:hypothetical protein
MMLRNVTVEKFMRNGRQNPGRGASEVSAVKRLLALLAAALVLLAVLVPAAALT